MFSSLNKKRTMPSINTDGIEFHKLSEFVGKVVKVNGFFFTDGKFGRQTVVLSNDVLINMPVWATRDFEKIENDDAMLNALLDGKCALTNIAIKSTAKGNTTIFEFTDI